MTKPLITAAVLCLSAPLPVLGEAPADLVFTNGAVYTVDAERSWASAVAVRDGRIVYVGDDSGAQAHSGADTEHIDLAGRMLMPGFHDSHMHPVAAGGRLIRCDLIGLAWPEGVYSILENCLDSHKPGQWFRAEKLDDAVFEQFVRASEWQALAVLFASVPAMVRQSDGMRMWLSPPAMQMVGLTGRSGFAGPEGVQRDPVTGQATGVVTGDAALLVYQALPVPDQSALRAGLRKASDMANRYGITSANEASASLEIWDALVAADLAGALTLRVQASLAWNPEEDTGQLASLVTAVASHSSDRLRALSVKLFVDGSAGINDGSLLQAYQNEPDYFGHQVYGDQLPGIVRDIDAAGLDVHLHAYYDRAVRDGLDAIEGALQANPDRDRRHQIAHLALVDPADIPRFAELEVTADIQPLWAYWNAQRSEESDRLGPNRSSRLVPVQSLFRTGARVVAGSDWISESMNPLYSIQVAVTRRPPDGSGPAWNPDERVSLEQMISAYTINGAWLARQEGLSGSIEVGKAADLIILEHNLFEVDPMDISEVRVLLTLLAGETVYRSPKLVSVP
jgi:predicted amidohydrolase YtcJ